MYALPDPSSRQPGLVRPEIVSSWERSVLAGLNPGQFEVPYLPDVDVHGRLTWAAAAILDRVAEDLAGSRIGLLLTDERGQVVDRKAPERGLMSLLDRIELAPGFLYSEERVGTNAIGTAIAQLGPSVVTGAEHFAGCTGPDGMYGLPYHQRERTTDRRHRPDLSGRRLQSSDAATQENAPLGRSSSAFSPRRGHVAMKTGGTQTKEGR